MSSAYTPSIVFTYRYRIISVHDRNQIVFHYYIRTDNRTCNRKEPLRRR